MTELDRPDLIQHSLTGVSSSMLAEIERGDANPTIAVLWKIANGYKVSFSALIEQSSKPTTILQNDSVQPIMEDNGKNINYPAFSFDEQHSFETYRILIAPGGSLPAESHLPGTEEFISVFTGSVTIKAADKEFNLNTGDSIWFMVDVRHTCSNIGKLEYQLSMLLFYMK